jgi:conjugative transposon TraM protein
LQAMARMQDQAASQPDPHMEKVDRMLDKVMRIQHPELVSRDTGAPREATVVLLEIPKREEALQGEEEATGFIEIGYGDKTDSARPGRDHAIEAMINGDQTLTAGSTVALRLTEETVIGGERLLVGQLVYGLASLSGERLMITVASLRVGGSIVPVALQVYDLDGLAGIRVPGALTRDVSKESASEAMSGLGLASLDPSLGSQAANASLQFAKSLASRKARLMRVSVPAGYRVLLKNTRSITH